MNFLNQKIAPLGMGCWPIAGPMYAGDTPLGYTNADDAQSIRTIHAALDHGVTLFDTAAAYGAGHAERLLAQALKGRENVQIVTKVGIGIDEATKQLSFDPPKPSDILPAIDACLGRLEREAIDLVFLHLNDMPVADARPLFAAMDEARKSGKIRAYGWSTDFSKSALAMADTPGFEAIQHAMNVFLDVPRIQKAVADTGLTTLIRSPLAMGVLSGKYDANTQLSSDDIRANAMSDWADYYVDGRVNPAHLATLDHIRELLTSGGRTLVQGALGWLWAKGAQNIPIPGARTPEQIIGLAGALEHGPLPESVMAELEPLLPKEPAGAPERPR